MSEPSARRAIRLLLAVVFMVDGVLHAVATDVFAAITPDWVPQPQLVVLATGVAAFLGGAGLVLRQTRKAAGVGLALYCVCVFPANVHHALGNVAVNGARLDWFYHAPRLLFQPVFTWACLWAPGVMDWPFRKPA